MAGGQSRREAGRLTERKRRAFNFKFWTGVACLLGILLIVGYFFPEDTHGRPYRSTRYGLSGTGFAILFVLRTIA